MTRSVAAVAACAAALAGCGGEEKDDRREAVAAYLADANTALQASAADFARAEEALRELSLAGAGAAKSERELARAAASLRVARVSLTELEPPPEPARRLHADAVRLVELQIRLADDLGRLAGHLPAAARVLADVEDARGRLQRALRRATTPAEQADAARAYAASASESLIEFRALDPPEILAEWHTGQLNVVATSSRLANELADALEAENEREIRRVLSAFDRISRNATAAARAQALAVRGFNERVEAQRSLVARIGREQRRLDLALR